MERTRHNFRGFGDEIEFIFKKIGVEKVVDKITRGKDCGCKKRRDFLNKVFPYNEHNKTKINAKS